MRVVGREHVHSLDFGIGERDLVIGDHVFHEFGIFLLFESRFGLDQIARVFHAHHVGERPKRGEMPVRGDSSAADDCNTNFLIHDVSPFAP